MKLTDINDYVKMVHEKHPDLSEDEVKRILVYGWKMILQYVRAGNDMSMITNKEFMFIGNIPVSHLAIFKTYCYKLSKRIAFMFQRTKSKWDGYYYFTRSENQYMDYLSQKNRKYKVFKDVFLYKLLEEVKIKESSAPYIFRLKEEKTNWLTKYYKEIKTSNAELIIVRDPLTIHEVMTSENKFKYIQQ